MKKSEIEKRLESFEFDGVLYHRFDKVILKKKLKKVPELWDCMGCHLEGKPIEICESLEKKYNFDCEKDKIILVVKK